MHKHTTPASHSLCLALAATFLLTAPPARAQIRNSPLDTHGPAGSTVRIFNQEHGSKVEYTGYVIYRVGMETYIITSFFQKDPHGSVQLKTTDGRMVDVYLHPDGVNKFVVVNLGDQKLPPCLPLADISTIAPGDKVVTPGADSRGTFAVRPAQGTILALPNLGYLNGRIPLSQDFRNSINAPLFTLNGQFLGLITNAGDDARPVPALVAMNVISPLIAGYTPPKPANAPDVYSSPVIKITETPKDVDFSVMKYHHLQGTVHFDQPPSAGFCYEDFLIARGADGNGLYVVNSDCTFCTGEDNSFLAQVIKGVVDKQQRPQGKAFVLSEPNDSSLHPTTYDPSRGVPTIPLSGDLVYEGYIIRISSKGKVLAVVSDPPALAEITKTYQKILHAISVINKNSNQDENSIP